MSPEDEYRRAHPERLRIYDISIDEFRDVTQYDIDQMQTVANSWGKIRLSVDAGVRELEELKRSRK